MKTLKHIGRLKNTGSRVLVIFRTLPGESNYALVLPVGNLTPDYHDTIMNLIETPQAQDAYEFGEILFIRSFSDGRKILQAISADRLMTRVATDQVIMTPDTSVELPLSDLNVLIAEQKNCAIDDLYTFVKGAVKIQDAAAVAELGRDVGEPEIAQATRAADLQPTDPNAVLSDADIAKGYRSQADAMFKEAQRLRKEADSLDPKPVAAPKKVAAPVAATTTKAKPKAKPKAAAVKEKVSD